MQLLKQYSRAKESLNHLKSRSVVLIASGILLLFLREKIATNLSVIWESQNYWGYFYVVDMVVIALFSHGIFVKNNVLVNVITETFAWFCWQDVVERLFLHNTKFTTEDGIFILIAIFTILYKTYKWTKAK